MSSCRSTTRRAPQPRGSTLIVTVIVVSVLTLIALAAIRRGDLEVESAGMRRRYAAGVNCVDAARELVVSQLAVSGARLERITLNRQIGDLTLSTGHYDTGPEGQVRADDSSNCGAAVRGAGATSVDVTNRSWGGLGSSCGVRIPVVCRDSEDRALELEFLVRMAL